ncbi:MAG TPA: hypothetical protein VFP80_05595 [Thermoanaerobaculia bacterium]|nr:hypothetical protein [Thermoanaerobaculia bacterium]
MTTLLRIDHALVMDTDDIPGRGGYAVVGISRGVAQADRAFIAGNFGISDYLHDPKTENRIFYSVFRMPSGRRAFVRRFARGTELRRNNTQRRLVVHTLLLDEDVWEHLYALPWLLLNAKLQIEGTGEAYRLNTDVSWVDEDASLPALLWDDGDGAASDVVAKLTNRLSVVGNQLGGRARDPGDVMARVITGLSSQSRLTLPQDAGYEWVTMLAWSMLPRHDRDELAWTQHDSMNLSGVAFPLANGAAADFDPARTEPAAWARELVKMNTASEESWLDLQERTAHDPLSVRRSSELDSWMKWRADLLRLHDNIHASDQQVVAYMTGLAEKVEKNPNAPWIDADEVLRLVWENVSDTKGGADARALAARTWGDRLRISGLGNVIFRAAPSRRWMARAAEEVGADALLRFFLYGGGEDPVSKPTRTAIAEWLIDAQPKIDNKDDLSALAFLVAADRSTALLGPLLELLLSTGAGLDALLEYLRKRQLGGVDLVHAAAPIAVRGAHRNKAVFLREIFLPRFETQRVDFELARDIATVLRDHRPSFHRFADKVTPEVRSQLMELLRKWVEDGVEAALPLAREILDELVRNEGSVQDAVPLTVALANVGEPARTWFAVLVRLAAKREDVAGVVKQIKPQQLELAGAMERLVPLLEISESSAPLRALVSFVRPAWTSGGSQFVRALRKLIDRAPMARSWDEIILAYAADHRYKRSAEVSELAAAFWAGLASDPGQLLAMKDAEIALLDTLDAAGVQRVKTAWTPKLGSLPRCKAADRVLEIVRERSYEQEITLAIRDIEQQQADEWTLNRLEVAMAFHYRGKAPDMFAREVTKYLGGGAPPARLARLLDLFASEEILPTVRLTLQTHVLGPALKSMKRRHWRDLRITATDDNLLALGAVMRLAYAAGTHADGRTRKVFERVWRENGRNDALDALEAARLERGPWRGLVRWIKRETLPALAA